MGTHYVDITGEPEVCCFLHSKGGFPLILFAAGKGTVKKAFILFIPNLLY